MFFATFLVITCECFCTLLGSLFLCVIQGDKKVLIGKIPSYMKDVSIYLGYFPSHRLLGIKKLTKCN